MLICNDQKLLDGTNWLIDLTYSLAHQEGINLDDVILDDDNRTASNDFHLLLLRAKNHDVIIRLDFKDYINAENTTTLQVTRDKICNAISRIRTLIEE